MWCRHWLFSVSLPSQAISTMFFLCLLYAFLKLLTVFDLFFTPGTMFQASITLFEKKFLLYVMSPEALLYLQKACCTSFHPFLPPNLTLHLLSFLQHLLMAQGCLSCRCGSNCHCHSGHNVELLAPQIRSGCMESSAKHALKLLLLFSMRTGYFLWL